MVGQHKWVVFRKIGEQDWTVSGIFSDEHNATEYAWCLSKLLGLFDVECELRVERKVIRHDGSIDLNPPR